MRVKRLIVSCPTSVVFGFPHREWWSEFVVFRAAWPISHCPYLSSVLRLPSRTYDPRSFFCLFPLQSTWCKSQGQYSIVALKTWWHPLCAGVRLAKFKQPRRYLEVLGALTGRKTDAAMTQHFFVLSCNLFVRHHFKSCTVFMVIGPCWTRHTCLASSHYHRTSRDLSISFCHEPVFHSFRFTVQPQQTLYVTFAFCALPSKLPKTDAFSVFLCTCIHHQMPKYKYATSCHPAIFMQRVRLPVGTCCVSNLEAWRAASKIKVDLHPLVLSWLILYYEQGLKRMNNIYL